MGKRDKQRPAASSLKNVPHLDVAKSRNAERQARPCLRRSELAHADRPVLYLGRQQTRAAYRDEPGARGTPGEERLEVCLSPHIIDNKQYPVPTIEQATEAL
jgi:hypothetical protein